MVRENVNPYCGTPGATYCSYLSNRGNGKRGGLAAYKTVCQVDGLYGYGYYHSTQELFDGYDADCVNGTVAEYVDPPASTGDGGCGEASCVPVQGTYVSHFSGPGCTGTESYYLPYDSYATRAAPGTAPGSAARSTAR